jgi:hypothetical protein
MPESQFERRQREAAERVLGAAMPDIQRRIRDILNAHSEWRAVFGSICRDDQVSDRGHAKG